MTLNENNELYVLLRQHKVLDNNKEKYMTGSVYHIMSTKPEMINVSNTSIRKDVYDYLLLHYHTEESGYTFKNAITKIYELELNSKIDKNIRYVLYKVSNIVDA